MGQVERMQSMLNDLNEQIDSVVSSPTAMTDDYFDKEDGVNKAQRSNKNLSDEFDDSDGDDESIQEDLNEKLANDDELGNGRGE